MAIASVRCASAALHSLPRVVEDREVEDDAWEADGEGDDRLCREACLHGLGAGSGTVVVVTRPDERRLDEVDTLAGVADVVEARSDSELPVRSRDCRGKACACDAGDRLEGHTLACTDRCDALALGQHVVDVSRVVERLHWHTM